MVSTFLRKSIFASLLALFTVSCSPESAAPPTPEANPTTNGSRTIVIADISDNPGRKIERFQPFADYLASQLNDIDVGIGEVEIAPDMETMADWLSSGKVHIYFDSPYPSMRVGELSGAKPILRRWKKGVDVYHTIIFTRTDSGIETLDDLKGQMIAFDEPVSTSGYMLPIGHLKQAGLKLVKKQSLTGSVAADRVGYIFSEDDDNSIKWVLTKRLAAAAVGSSDFLKIPEETRQQLTILAETETIARNVVVVSPTLTNEEVTAIEAVLLSMDRTEEGKTVLTTFENTTKFDEFPEGVDRALERMQQFYKLAQEQ